MDTTVFFRYSPLPPERPIDLGFLADSTAEQWDAVLAASELLRFHPGEVVLRAGERDRALYVLLDGCLEVETSGVEISSPAAVGVAAFLDGQPRAVSLRAHGHGELARLSWDAYEALAARDPRLGRAILIDLARGLAAQLRTPGATVPGWTG